MKLGVIIPAWRAGATLPALLGSLAAQSRPVDEIIVVDDASDDDTATVAAGFPGTRLLRRDRNGGAGAARNTGAFASRADVFVFLDADTVADDPRLLEHIAAAFAAAPEVAAMSGCYPEDNGDPRPFPRYLDAVEASMRPLTRGPAPGSLNGSLCAIRRDAFRAAGGFPEDRRNAVEDIALGRRLTSLGYRHDFDPGLRVRHHQPAMRAYVRELLPRSRHYLRLLGDGAPANEIMGGGREGVARLAYLFGGGLALVAAPVQPVYAAAALAVALWPQRGWLRRLAPAGPRALAVGLGAHALASAAIVSGAVLGVADRLRHRFAGRLADARVVVAYLRSLLTPGAGGYLIHYLTHRCNAHCRHCFDAPQRAAVGVADELSLPEIERLTQTAGPLGHVSLTGGEPLLRDELPEIYAAWVEAGVRSLSLSTNGSLPERLARVVPAMLVAAPAARLIVTVSVDGSASTHDALRGVPGLSAQVDRTLAVLADLRQWWPQLRVHACLTLSRANLADAPATVMRLASAGLEQIELNRLRGTPADTRLGGVSDADYDRVQALVAAAMPRCGGLAALFSWLDRRLFASVRNPSAPWPAGSCLAGRRLEVVLADGRVLPCEMIADVQPDAAAHDGFVLGRLHDTGGDLRPIRDGAATARVCELIVTRDCRCSFECAWFATTVYRPWRLLRPMGGRAVPVPGPQRR